MSYLVWHRLNREQLTAALPRAVVILPVGSTEQHGPYVATSTDTLLASAVATRAAQLAAEDAMADGADFIVAPAMPFGISAHHQRFGGTLSVRTETLYAVLTDLIDSLEDQGATKLLIVNGHGGNMGAATAAAAAADTRPRITVAALNYWDYLTVAPGHAGEVETALVRHVDASLITDPIPPRHPIPDLPGIGVALHGAWIWERLGGYTDDPSTATAERGRTYFEDATISLAELLVSFSRLRPEA